jgi:polyphosphate kinase 2 (PPK2 family)
MTQTPQDQLSRIKAEIADSFDEELEMQMEEDRLDDLVAEGMSEPAEQTIERKIYFRELFRLQHELVRLQDWVQHKKLKVVVLFEGRDSAGKGGAIKRVTQRLNPRVCRTVALPAPTEREWCSLTEAGTIAPESSASWDSAPRKNSRSSSARCLNSNGCSSAPESC